MHAGYHPACGRDRGELRNRVRVLHGTVLDREQTWPPYQRLRFHIPDLGPIEPGQALLARPIADRDPRMPRVLLPAGQDRALQTVTCLVEEPRTPEHDLFSAWQSGHRIQVVGPVGRPFHVAGSTRRALLVGAGIGHGALVALAHALTQQGIEVTFVSWPAHDGATMPAAALPPEVEYVVTPEAPGAGDALPRQLDPLTSWADQLFVAVPTPLLTPLMNLLRRRLLRLRRGFAQALLTADLLPCGVGACDLCALHTRDGYRRLCRDGLVFDLLSLV